MSSARLDHIIILVPYSTLSAIPQQLSDAFVVSPGGRHADNKTENRLILLKDGVYLELIAFINDDDALKEGHWWGKLPNGIIDFALTSKDVADVEAVRQRLGELKGGIGAVYEQPRAGGRKRDDGVEVKWYVTFPSGSNGASVPRGSVPFWCHDVTDRELRVPVHGKKTTEHPSGALGVKELVLGVPRGRLEAFKETYAAIVGTKGEVREDGTISYDVGTPFGKGKWGRITLEEHGEEARVLRLVVGLDAGSDPAPGVDRSFGGGNNVRIDFSTDD